MRRSTNYKWALVLALAAAIPVPAAAAQARDPDARVTIAVLPAGTGVEELSRVDGVAVGLMSAGLGRVSASQTYLDVARGNRRWRSIDERRPPRCASRPGGSSFECMRRIAPRVALRRTALSELPGLVAALRGGDLLLAFSRPPPAPRRPLALAVAGRGFEGVLTSPSTRMPGYVLATDLAPTIRDRLGLPIPDRMEGRPIDAEAGRDPARLPALERRLSKIAPRRGPVIGVAVGAWLALTLAAGLALRGRGLRVAAPTMALSAVYMPALLLLTAALEPSLQAERLIVMAGAPLLAGLTLWRLSPHAALATACAVTVGAYMADLIAGSPLTALSLMGPNPALGARFYGIGNELEAVLVVLVPIGTAAGLAAAGLAGRAAARWFAAPAPAGLAGRTAARWFAATGLPAAAVFAAGRFGADVGAAIALPIGGAVAASVALGRRPALVTILAVPLAALAALAAADLVTGGDSHLSRSVLEAGGLDEVAEVAERRLRLSAASFTRPANTAFLAATALLVVAALRDRRRLRAWLDEPPIRAGFLGGLAATAAATLANDSGALLLMIGSGYLALYVVFVRAAIADRLSAAAAAHSRPGQPAAPR